MSATMTKIIKEMLPPDVRVARDAQDLLIECCVGWFSISFFSFYLNLTSIDVLSKQQNCLLLYTFITWFKLVNIHGAMSVSI